MSVLLRRLFPGPALVVLTIVLVLGALAAGAALAPQPLPDENVALAEPLPPTGSQLPTSAPGRHAVLGIIVAIGNSGLRVRTNEQTTPVLVGIGARTVLHLNGKPATLADYHVGDVVAAVGRTGARGAFVARTVMVAQRRGASLQALLQRLARRTTPQGTQSTS